jgi:hypothetical protein
MQADFAHLIHLPLLFVASGIFDSLQKAARCIAYVSWPMLTFEPSRPIFELKHLRARNSMSSKKGIHAAITRNTTNVQIKAIIASDMDGPSWSVQQAGGKPPETLEVSNSLQER